MLYNYSCHVYTFPYSSSSYCYIHLFTNSISHQIKYDTRVIATTNGSIKLVRRDRTVIELLDDGSLSYMPYTAWDAAVRHTFLLLDVFSVCLRVNNCIGIPFPMFFSCSLICFHLIG